MRFKLDENLHPDAALVLRRAGHDVETVWDEQLQGAADSRLADVLKRERRVFVTFDVGFADIRTYPPGDFAGLIVLRLQRQDRRAVVRVITRLLDSLIERPLAGQLWIVNERGVRVRSPAHRAPPRS